MKNKRNNKHFKTLPLFIDKCGPKIPATSKIEFLVMIVNGFANH